MLILFLSALPAFVVAFYVCDFGWRANALAWAALFALPLFPAAVTEGHLQAWLVQTALFGAFLYWPAYYLMHRLSRTRP